jgi:hypothetical protein
MANQEASAAKQLLYISGAIFLIASSVFYGWWALQPNWFSNIKAEVTNQPYARTVTVSAEGKITAKPDVAIVSLSVVSSGTTVKVVTKDGNEKMDAVIGAVKALGVESKDITSSQYNLYPEYSYLSKTPKLTGYKLDQEVTVKVRKLEAVEDVLDAGIKAGSNQVGQLSFEIDDASGIKKEARGIAFAKAREKADEMAAAVGVKLGRVITFTEDAGGQMYPQAYANYSMDAMRTESAAPAPSIEPGSKEISLTVSVTYEIQ